MISLIYLTNRIDCKFHWAFDSFFNQYDNSIVVEWIIVDFYKSNSEKRSEYFFDHISDKFNFKHINPKPCSIQGKYKITKDEWFAAANARNTGICYADGSYAVFIDDLSILGPKWWEAVKRGFQSSQVIAGCYAKIKGLDVGNGVRISGEDTDGGLDARLKQSRTSRYVSGTELFGCSFGIPVDTYLSINGMDEALNGLGMEDCVFGIQLQKAGHKIWFDVDMYSEENDEMHGNGLIFKREDKLLTQEQYEAARQRLGCTKYYHQGGRTDSSHLFLDMVYSQEKPWTFGNNFNLSELKKTKEFTLPTGNELHWVDLTLIKDM